MNKGVEERVRGEVRSSRRTSHWEAFDHCKYTAFALRREDFGECSAVELQDFIYILAGSFFPGL